LREQNDLATEKTTANNNNMPEGMGWSVVLSIATFFASIAAIIVWLFFYAENFNVYQNIVIVVVIILGFVALMGATWAAWGMKQAERRSERGDSKSC
jgi:fatty acid desaturase